MLATDAWTHDGLPGEDHSARDTQRKHCQRDVAQQLIMTQIAPRRTHQCRTTNQVTGSSIASPIRV